LSKDRLMQILLTVTALIDSRGKLTEAQVQEKLYVEIERERSGGVR
jgi:hypothetical protein